MAKTITTRMKQAEAGNLSYTEFLGLLLEDEANARADNKRQRLYKAAKLPFEKGLEDFDFTFQPSINKREIIELSSCQFLEARKNLLFIGQTGTGKTHLSVAIALAALEQGKAVLFGPAGAFAQEYTVMRNTLSDNKLYGHEKASQYCISDLTVL